MTRNSFAVTIMASAACFLPLAASAQTEGMLPTQALVRADSKENVIPTAQAVTLQIDGKTAKLDSLSPVAPGNAQVALLIDDGLSRSSGIQLDDMKKFATNFPAGTEVFIGYMRNGTVEQAVPFSTDREEVMAKVRLPLGAPGISASPYFCISEFVRHWPGTTAADEGSQHKARFLMVITNGVDPYNGSTSILNQDSPYVAAAAVDAQRAGVSVSSIYYSDAGFRGRGSFSGQSYLSQMAEATGGVLYNQGTINPVSLTPLFKQFARDISETYVASFGTDAGKGGREHLVRLKVSTSTPKLKLRTAENVRPGNLEGAGQ